MPRLPTPVIEKVVVLSYENEEVEEKKKEFFSVLRKAIVKRHIAETSKMAEQQNANAIEKG